MKKYLFAGPASRELGERIAHAINAELVEYDFKVFPDGESKIRIITNVQDSNVIVVQSTYPPTDSKIIQLLFASHYFSQNGAKVTAVVPYLAYSRQDKEFLPGEVISIGVIAHLFRNVGIRRLVSVDIHSADAMAQFPFPVYSVSAIPYLAKYVKQNFSYEKPIVVSPDFGAKKRAEVFAKLVDGSSITLKKERDKNTGDVRIEKESLDVNGKDVIIIDDIISSGGTVAKAAKILYEAGANEVVACCTHPILVGSAIDVLKNAGIKRIIGTNTVSSDYSIVDITNCIVEHLMTLNE